MITGLKNRIHALESVVVPRKLHIMLIKEEDDAEAKEAEHRKATGWDGDYITVRLVKLVRPNTSTEDLSETPHAH